jgi:hypothetical protein
MTSVAKEKTKPQVLIGTFGNNELPHTISPARYSTYRAMRKDPTIALARTLVVAPVLASSWSIEAEQDAPDGAQEFVNEQMQPIRMHLLRTAMLGGIDYGWQSYEKVFEMTGSEIRIKKLKPLLQDYTLILIEEETGAFAGLKNYEVTLDVAQCLLLSFDVEGTDWYGYPLMENVRNAYDEWNEVNNGAKRYDKKVAGSHWVVHYPDGVSLLEGAEVDNYEVAKSLINNLQASGAIAVPRKVEEFVDDLNKDAPDAWRIELLSDSGTSKASFIDRMKYLDALKVRGLGMPERAILEGEFGTKAEAEAHADFAIVNMELRHKMVVQDVNWHYVNQLLRFNYGPDVENKVYIQPAPIADLALQYLRDVYTSILTSPEGFVQEIERIDLEAMKDKLGIPVTTPDVDEEGITVDVETLMRSKFPQEEVADDRAGNDGEVP